ncbi:hypothetical protein AB0K43_15175 [Kitasatospora sp. NPDC049258]|uniref:hypothetical protein n=1 Tax=Kitasatospora sp. NPDC049258 TaxID=3155394 RepID=UPI00341D14FE
MGLFSRKNTDAPADRLVQSATELRHLGAHKHYEKTVQERNAVGAAAARAADHGSPQDIVRTHAALQKADEAVWTAIKDADRWGERRYRR